MSEPQGSEGTTQRLPVIEREAEPDRSDQSAYGPPPVLEAQAGGGARRFWSARRVPAGIVALLLLLLAGIFLYDIAAVRADRPAMHWRRALSEQLAERPLDDIWVLIGAGVAAALGLWLIVLALTGSARPPPDEPHPPRRPRRPAPGRRRHGAARPGHGGVRRPVRTRTDEAEEGRRPHGLPLP